VTKILDEYVREERFTFEQPNRTRKSFSTVGHCRRRYEIGKKNEAEWIANELRKVKHKGEKEISECCVKLYTIESFLYKLVNKVLREAVIEKASAFSEFVSETDKNYGRTLGPYCWLYYKNIFPTLLKKKTLLFFEAQT
jgi:hypothetical protein